MSTEKSNKSIEGQDAGVGHIGVGVDFADEDGVTGTIQTFVSSADNN